MPSKIIRFAKTLKYPSYIIFFVTGRCNARCKMCFYEENMRRGIGADNELSLDEYEKISKNIKLINILGISGGEPFLRDDLSEIIKILYKNCKPLVVDLPTNSYFTDRVVTQVEAIVSDCREMIVDIQLSIDGPEDIHNEIRGLKDGYKRLKETYKALLPLKKRFKNLRVKACVVYSHYNQDHIEELFHILDRDFSELDRVVLSVTHGSVSNKESLDFDWDKYFALCNQIRQSTRVNNILDYHSLITLALRMIKNDYLKDVLMQKDFYKQCGAGKRVVVINETGRVFPCEPIWYSVGELRENNYDLDAILYSDEMREFNKNIKKEKCNCYWGLPISNNLIYKPAYYPTIISEMLKIAGRSMFANRMKGK